MIEAKDIYQRLGKVNARGTSLAASGLGDIAMYEGRVTDATSILEEGITKDLANENRPSAAMKLVTLAEAQLLQGQKARSLASVDRALGESKKTNVLVGAALVYLDAGQKMKARNLASDLGGYAEPEAQAYAKLIEGAVLRTDAIFSASVKALQDAQKIFDTWLGHFELGRTYLEAGFFAEAADEFDVCLKRPGEVTALFIDEIPTYRYLPAVYYYRGRAKEGLKSPTAADDYKTFLAIEEKADRTQLVEDARNRLALR
jgi:tetratricopeptide (TPR) repeat protein